ncbi:UNVERIFIED_CONTAM: hypothetical protein FKN15_048093 [Acipenser sinensis]
MILIRLCGLQEKLTNNFRGCFHTDAGNTWLYKQCSCQEFYLKASVLVWDSATATSIVLLIDCFLYWVDASRKLLQIAKALHKHSPATPIMPQVVIRQARISVNSGTRYEAAELTWAPLIVFNALPQPDKKVYLDNYGPARSFFTFAWVFLKNAAIVSLSAAEAARLALVFSQFTPLFVLSSVASVEA